MEPDRLMTVRQAARYLCVRDSVVRGWIRSGELRSVDLGDSATSKLRITPDAIAAFSRRGRCPRRKPAMGHDVPVELAHHRRNGSDMSAAQRFSDHIDLFNNICQLTGDFPVEVPGVPRELMGAACRMRGPT